MFLNYSVIIQILILLPVPIYLYRIVLLKGLFERVKYISPKMLLIIRYLVQDL